MEESTSLEAKIRKLEDIAEIIKLTSTYGLYINKGWNGKSMDFDKLSSIFTEDATWESSATNVKADGIDEIIAILKEKTAGITFAMHSFTNPIIDINGDMATGNWLMWACTNSEINHPNHICQSEDIKYMRTPEGWRINAVNLHLGQRLIQ